MKLRLAFAACAVIGLAATAHAQTPEEAVLKIRAATGRFRNVQNALLAGYAPFRDCTAEPGQGAMGFHYANGVLANDAILDPTQPEALMYEKDANGKLQLVGVEFIVYQDHWDAAHGSPPTLFGQPFTLVPAPNRFDLPSFYELHVWAWKDNPSGTFADWNPNVTCP